jgi:hypothetical protein
LTAGTVDSGDGAVLSLFSETSFGERYQTVKNHVTVGNRAVLSLFSGTSFDERCQTVKNIKN